MSDQLDPTVDLATVTKSVAETDRRRALVEEELDQAQSVVESLKARSLSLSESVLDLQRQLDATKLTKAQEDAELSKISQQRKRAIDELAALTSVVDELRSASERDALQIGANLKDARAHLATIESNVRAATTEATTLQATIASLRENIGDARRRADELDSQLAQVDGTARSVIAAADQTQSRLNEASAALAVAAGRKEETDSACSALAAISNALHAKTNDAATAMKSIDRLMREQDVQTASLAARVAAIGKLVGQTEPRNGSASSATPPPAPAASNNRFADALYTVGVLAHERLLAQDEADHLGLELRSDAGNAVLRESWSKTVARPHSTAHRLIFAEVLRAVGDVKAAIVYYEQAALAAKSHPIVRYLVALAYLKMDLLDRATRVINLLSRDRGGRILSRIVDALRLEQAGRPDEAVTGLTDVLAAKGLTKWEYDETLLQLGRLHERNNNVHAALSCYQQIDGGGRGFVDVKERIRALEQQPV